jgi:hypothetical protein
MPLNQATKDGFEQIGAPVSAMARRIFRRQSEIFPSQRRGEPAALIAIGQMLPRAWTRRKQNAESRRRCFPSMPRIDALSARMPALEAPGRSQPGIAVLAAIGRLSSAFTICLLGLVCLLCQCHGVARTACGTFHEPSSASGLGQYSRGTMKNVPLGAGSQFGSFSLPGDVKQRPMSSAICPPLTNSERRQAMCFYARRFAWHWHRDDTYDTGCASGNFQVPSRIGVRGRYIRTT